MRNIIAKKIGLLMAALLFMTTQVEFSPPEPRALASSLPAYDPDRVAGFSELKEEAVRDPVDHFIQFFAWA